ncbi:unnamed protein product [Nippostrongylus brasiliensis]|uniref:Serine/threonine-protein kinase zyg-8 (inferred by orthology to a C. elegans protein) n=1 Tax=Nippostrongylus brasiliensis TaxID=27835 RepID=A0A0N4XJN9_NIPBR|nr:unnamed protein product [Nippostrongylus brasiliensis]
MRTHVNRIGALRSRERIGPPMRRCWVFVARNMSLSFDQVMTDLTCVVKLDSGAIRKLFALGGNAVLTLQDFFREDDVFIAYGNERASADDFFVISEG